MQKEIKQFFEEVCKVNDNIIEKVGEVTPVAFILGKETTALALCFRNSQEKEIMRNMLLQTVASTEKLKAYIIIFDTKLTLMDKKTGKTEVNDAVIRQVYTPKEKIFEMVIYKDKKIIKKEILPMKRNKDNVDMWDLWRTNDMDEKVNSDYQKFKQKNKEIYKDTF